MSWMHLISRENMHMPPSPFIRITHLECHSHPKHDDFLGLPGSVCSTELRWGPAVCLPCLFLHVYQWRTCRLRQDLHVGRHPQSSPFCADQRMFCIAPHGEWVLSVQSRATELEAFYTLAKKDWGNQLCNISKIGLPWIHPLWRISREVIFRLCPKYFTFKKLSTVPDFYQILPDKRCQ